MLFCLARWDRKWPASWSFQGMPGGLDRRGGAPARGSADRSPHRVDSCATACRGLIVISTLDYLYRDKPLGCDLARQNVNDLLRGFGDSRYT